MLTGFCGQESQPNTKFTTVFPMRYFEKARLYLDLSKVNINPVQAT
jgi:hypothetical protein